MVLLSYYFFRNVTKRFLPFILGEQRTQARIMNSTIHDSSTTIEPLLTNAGIIPVNFPQNYNSIENAIPTVIDGLLNAYNLEACNGTQPGPNPDPARNAGWVRVDN